MRRIVLLAGLAVCACSSEEQANTPASPCAEVGSAGSPFGVRCGQLVDDQGRVVFLRGVNARIEGVFDVSFDDGRTALEEVPPLEPTDAEAMRGFGFDALRLPINWSAVEPTEDGGFDDSYLARVEEVVDLVAAAGLVVLIDFHQDAYSKEIGEDGAPLWAIEPPPTELLEGPLTDLEDRRLSDQVLAAFETFFGESGGGPGLRQRFVAMASHVAGRFAGHPAVMGFEIFNEPQADDAGIARLNEVAYPALREAAPDKLYVFEPPVIRNFTDQSTIPAEPLGPMSGYAPHVYTLSFTATDEQKQNATKETLRRSNENARLEADGWSAPLIITEWGIDPAGPKARDYVTWQSELQEEYQASSFYWLWKEQSQGMWGCHDYDSVSDTFAEREAVREALARVRPAAIAGWPSRYGFDRDGGRFEMVFAGDPQVRAPHLIAVAPVLGEPISVSCDGAEVVFELVEEGLFEVPCAAGEVGEHELVVLVTP